MDQYVVIIGSECRACGVQLLPWRFKHAGENTLNSQHPREHPSEYPNQHPSEHTSERPGEHFSEHTINSEHPCCCCCSYINSHSQVRGHRTGSSRSGAEEYPREKHKPKVVHAYITADAIHASTRNIYSGVKVKSGVSLRCARSILVHTSQCSRLEKPT